MQMIEKIMQLYWAHVPQGQIAARFEISQATVSRYIARHKAKLQRDNRCPCCRRKLPKQAQGDSDASR